VGSTHDWILFFTNKGRVYRAKAYELPEANRTPAARTWPTSWPSSPTRRSPRSCRSRTTGRPVPGPGHGERAGEEDPADRLRLPAQRRRHRDQPADSDELVGAALIDPEQDLLLVTRKAMSIRFKADDATLRPMGRATEGVRGIALSRTTRCCR
jgi:DNA gyrase subunit A